MQRIPFPPQARWFESKIAAIRGLLPEPGAGLACPSLPGRCWKHRWAGLLCAVALAGVSDRASAACDNTTVEGEYGYQFQGKQLGATSAETEDIVGATLRRFDGAGQFTEKHTFHFSLSGVQLDVEESGTYQINADCTGSSQLTVPDAPFTIDEKFVVVEDGDEILTVLVAPPPLIATGTAKRITKKNASATPADLADIKTNLAAIAQRLGLVPKK